MTTKIETPWFNPRLRQGVACLDKTPYLFLLGQTSTSNKMPWQDFQQQTPSLKLDKPYMRLQIQKIKKRS